MKWPELDLAKGAWRHRVKGGYMHHHGLPKQAVAFLLKRAENRDDQSSPYVLPAIRGSEGFWCGVQKSCQRIRALVDFDFRPHDVRRTVATMMGGFSEEELPHTHIRWVLGHLERTVTERHYNAAMLERYVAPTRKALQLWADKLDAIMQ